MSTALEASVDVLEAIYHRRSVRQYTGERLDEELVKELLDAAVHAPTAMHAEPWAFAIIQDKGRLHELSEQAKALQLRSGELPPELRSRLADPAFNVFYDAGTLVVICRRTHAPFADADCWLAAQNLMLAAHAEGLGSCCVGFALQVLNQPEVKQELRIPEEGAAVAAIILGHAAGEPAGPVRKPAQVLAWLKAGKETGYYYRY